MKRIMTLALVLAPTAALAHPGHGFGLGAGGLHTLTGVDHLLAMVGVGLWAALQSGVARWAMPVTFLAAMVIGFALNLSFLAVEPAILASVVLLGAAVSMAIRAPLGLTLPLLAAFGLVHGSAHASDGNGAAFALGMFAATAALHAVGLSLGMRINRAALRATGALTFVAGLALAITG